MSQPDPRPDPESPPPVLGSWRNLYLFVLGTLGAVILSLYLITRAYS